MSLPTFALIVVVSFIVAVLCMRLWKWFSSSMGGSLPIEDYGKITKIRPEEKKGGTKRAVYELALDRMPGRKVEWLAEPEKCEDTLTVGSSIICTYHLSSVSHEVIVDRVAFNKWNAHIEY